MSMFMKPVSIFVVAAALGATVAYPTVGEAAYRYIHPYSCSIRSNAQAFGTDSEHGIDSDGFVANRYGGGNATFICPYPEDSGVPRSSLDQAVVYYYDGSALPWAGVAAAACVTFLGGGGECGSMLVSGGSTDDDFTGYGNFGPNIQVWKDHPSSPAFLSIGLPQWTSVTNNSQIRGIRIEH
jgi:hypothetical protein